MKKSEVDIKIELRVHIARKYKVQTKAAEAWGCSRSFVSLVLSGGSQPTKVMLDDAGFKKLPYVPRYAKV